MARILIVDDDDALRPVLATVLSRAGHEVVQATDGLRALATIRGSVFDVVLTDIVMPEQDGVGFIMGLRREFPKIPVIAMSGGATNTNLYLEVAKKLGAKAILYKPFKVEALLAALATLGIHSKPSLQ